MVSDRRYALAIGWARYLNQCIDTISCDAREIEKLRGSFVGIAVHEDYHALRWQRLEFRKHRAQYAIGAFGIKGHSLWSGTGWEHSSPAEIVAMNKAAIAKYRMRAHRALKMLQKHDLLPCPQCCGAGYFIIDGESYPCDNCQKPGIIYLEKDNNDDNTKGVDLGESLWAANVKTQ